MQEGISCLQKDCWEINVSAYVTVDLKFFLKLWIRHNAIAAHDTNHVLKSVHAVLEKMLIVDLLFFFFIKAALFFLPFKACSWQIILIIRLNFLQ